MKPSLSEIPFLADAPADVLAAMDAVADWFSIPSGWALINAGEPPEGVYFLISGSLAAFKPTDKGGYNLLGYIRHGEPIGEMAMIAQEPHSGSVFAMRDSEILRLPPAAFDLLVHAHPAMMERMAKIMLTRARATNRSNPRAESKVYAFVSTSPTIDLKLRAKTLQAGAEAPRRARGDRDRRRFPPVERRRHEQRVVRHARTQERRCVSADADRGHAVVPHLPAASGSYLVLRARGCATFGAAAAAGRSLSGASIQTDRRHPAASRHGSRGGHYERMAQCVRGLAPLPLARA